jgi:hypothetical protein
MAARERALKLREPCAFTPPVGVGPQAHSINIRKILITTPLDLGLAVQGLVALEAPLPAQTVAQLSQTLEVAAEAEAFPEQLIPIKVLVHHHQTQMNLAMVAPEVLV